MPSCAVSEYVVCLFAGLHNAIVAGVGSSFRGRILARGLAELFGRGGGIEQIVGDLKE